MKAFLIFSLFAKVALAGDCSFWNIPNCLPLYTPPAKFDLRNTEGKNFVSSVKSQSGGTCWTHSTMAAIESNLLVTDVWKQSGETGEANLAEYHLDWWNGFNLHFNSDAAEANGLTVHEGGDYRVATAYLSRAGGPVRNVDAQSFNSAPKQNDPSYKYFYVRDVEWYSAGSKLENINRIKEAIQNHGVIGTALAWDSAFYLNNNFYQPTSDTEEPNHAVAIVGWDDTRATQAPKPGAWLVKNSWGSAWGNQGYFWISYYDKVAGHHPEMGAVSFQNVEVLKYKNIYSLDLHGWRDTKAGVTDAFNAFVAKGNPSGKETLKSVAFYTADDDVDYTVAVYKSFAGGQLSDKVSSAEGNIAVKGYHTVDLDWTVPLKAGEKFYVALSLSDGGHAFDRTSDVPVLLGSKARVIVKSSAKPGESFYRKNGSWIDLTKDDTTANFCIKALTLYE